MKFVELLLILSVAVPVAAAAEAKVCAVTVLPEQLATLSVPLKLGYQLGIPARDNSSFYAECFSTDALRQEITRLNERVEIGLLVAHSVNPDTGEITVVLNNESSEFKGINLRTGYLLQGRSYTARVKGEKVWGERGVKLRIRHEYSREVSKEGEDCVSRWDRERELSWNITPRISGFYRCSFLIHPHSSVKLRDFSLLPDDSMSMWRRESIDVLRSAGAGVFRWPIVEGMDFYNWYDGIGARAKRMAVQPEKTGLNHHDFGTAEYVNFCRVVGVEPLICVPLYTPGCGDARVRDLNHAARIAADWVAYCNAANDHPLAVLRKKNGEAKPLHVKNWELNAPPVGALISAEMVVSACLRTIIAMKEEDSGILVGVTLQEGSSQTLELLLEQAGKRVDFVACNAEGADQIVKDFNQRNNTAIMLAGTKLSKDYGDYAARLLEGLEPTARRGREYYINWYCSLGLANAAVSRLNRVQDGPVCLPYHAEQVLGLDRGFTRLSTDIGLLSAMIGRFPAVSPLAFEQDGKEPGAPLVYPAWSEGGGVLVVFIYNPDLEGRTVVLDLRKLKKKFTFWIMDQLSADMSREAKSESVPVLREQRAGAAMDKMIEFSVGAASFTRVLVKE